MIPFLRDERERGSIPHLAESHEEDVGDTSGGDGDEGKAHLKDGVGTLHAVDELVASEGDGDGDGDGGAVGLADVGHGLGDGGVTVGVVEDGVVRLVDPLPEDDVEGLGLDAGRGGRTVGAARSIPAWMGMLQGTKAPMRPMMLRVSPVWGWTLASRTTG